MRRITEGADWTVDVRRGNTLLEMAEWKRIVADAVRQQPVLHVHYSGGANQITGYRLYYLLQFAKQAGVRQLELHSDGAFWIEEATDWLWESGVDRIAIAVPGAAPDPGLAGRIARLRARVTAAGTGPAVAIDAA
jgi:hypothetical protein